MPSTALLSQLYQYSLLGRSQASYMHPATPSPTSQPRRREELAHRLSQEQAAERAPPAAAPTARAVEFGAAGEEVATAGKEGGSAGGAQGGAGRLRRHHEPPPAGPAAAAEPAVSPDQPSVPSGERTAATTRGGAGVQVAAHGFATQVRADVLAELAAATAPPQARAQGREGWEGGQMER